MVNTVMTQLCVPSFEPLLPHLAINHMLAALPPEMAAILSELPKTQLKAIADSLAQDAEGLKGLATTPIESIRAMVVGVKAQLLEAGAAAEAPEPMTPSSPVPSISKFNEA